MGRFSPTKGDYATVILLHFVSMVQNYVCVQGREMSRAAFCCFSLHFLAFLAGFWQAKLAFSGARVHYNTLICVKPRRLPA